jgi:gp16 family phage-associated protein
MRTQELRTGQDIRADWLRKGVTLQNWADAHGFNRVSVMHVLTGRNAGSRGVGHKIAVMLGMKDGEILEGGGDE